MNQPTGGRVLPGVEQLVGRVQTGAEQLETTQEDRHDVSPGEGTTSVTAQRTALASATVWTIFVPF